MWAVMVRFTLIGRFGFGITNTTALYIYSDKLGPIVAIFRKTKCNKKLQQAQNII